MRPLDEEVILIRDIRKQPEKFGIIYERHYQSIFNYAFKRLIDFDTAKDITSEVFLKAFLNIGQFRCRGVSVLNWLYRIATNEINLYYRAKKYRPKLLYQSYNGFHYDKYTYDLEEEKRRAEEELAKHKQFLKMQEELRRLPLHYQEVITLKYFERLKIKDICQILNKKEGTVKSLLSRGIDKLSELCT